MLEELFSSSVFSLEFYFSFGAKLFILSCFSYSFQWVYTSYSIIRDWENLTAAWDRTLVHFLSPRFSVSTMFAVFLKLKGKVLINFISEQNVNDARHCTGLESAQVSNAGLVRVKTKWITYKFCPPCLINKIHKKYFQFYWVFFQTNLNHH